LPGAIVGTNGETIVTENADADPDGSIDGDGREADDGQADGSGNGDADTGSGTDLEERVAALERTAGELRKELDRRERVLRLLAGNADVEPVTARCPECETGKLRRRSGLSWAKLDCPDCGAVWEL
jgi:hypothetical protein